MTPRVASRDSPTVLIVDASRDAADGLGDTLSGYGYTTRVAYRAEDALALAAADPPDAVLLGLATPATDGWDLARRLRGGAGGKRPLLVAVSGCGDEAARRRSADAGVHLHLPEPVHPAVLVGLLKRFRQAPNARTWAGRLAGWSGGGAGARSGGAATQWTSEWTSMPAARGLVTRSRWAGRGRGGAFGGSVVVFVPDVRVLMAASAVGTGRGRGRGRV